MKPDTSLSLTDIVDASEWINIEANDSDYLGDLSKLEIMDGDYYVLDKINHRCVLRFSQNGVLLNKIGSSGAGPGEYPAVLDFSIDRLNKQVILLSMQSTLYIYSSDGEFKKKVKLDDGILNAISANSESMIATSGYAGASNGKDCWLLHKFDSDFRNIGKWINYKTPLMPQFSPLIKNPLSSIGKDSYFVDILKRRIFQYDGKSGDTYIFMSFELDKPMPEQNFKDNMMFMTEQLNYNWIKDCLITSDYTFVGYIYEGRYALSIISNDGTPIKSGYYEGRFPEGVASNNGYIYSLVATDAYWGYWQNIDLKIKPAKDVSENTNFLILKWKPSQNLKQLL